MWLLQSFPLSFDLTVREEKEMKKIAFMLALIMVITAIPISVSADVTPISTLVSVEEVLYGEVRTGSLMERIERVERDIYGEPQTGAVLVRIDRVQSFLQSNQAQGGSLRLQLNLAEWGFLARLTDGQPLVKRLERLETDLLGTPQAGPISERTRELMMMIWGTTSLDVRQVELKEQTLVRIRLLTAVDSATSREGDVVRYRVTEDVMVDGRVVIPVGAEGIGRIAEVSSAGRLGKDGRIEIDFGKVPSLDGNLITLHVSERATEQNRSLELAAGASMAGVLLLGPIGLVGGYFIRGKDVQIGVGTEFFVETTRTVRTSGFFLRPAQ